MEKISVQAEAQSIAIQWGHWLRRFGTLIGFLIVVVVSSRRARAVEPVERAARVFSRHTGAGVGHFDQHATGDLAQSHDDCRSRRRVRAYVAEQVG